MNVFLFGLSICSDILEFMTIGISAINDEVQRVSAFVRPLMGEMSKVVVGQSYLVERLIIGLLARRAIF